MKLKSQKSQVTMIIVVGLVLFILVGLAFYLSKSAVKKSSQQITKKAETASLDTQPVKEFISKCQDKLAKEAIVLIGKQGGYIYRSQGGDLVDYDINDNGIFFVNYAGMKVSYGIKSLPLYSVFPYSAVIPDYPWLAFPYKTINSNDELFDGIFGLSTMPPLNVSQGPNSIQSQIGSYIDHKIEGCIDLRTFMEQGYDITINKSKTTVIIASSDVKVKSVMPTKIINKVTNEETDLELFTTTVDVRLGEMYYFIKDLTQKDTGNIRFNLKDSGNSKNSFRLNVLENVLSKDDMVVVVDDKSQIAGKPFEYMFARKNRAPALYYYKGTYLRLAEDATITQDVLLQGGQLRAEDPDEDQATFKITPQPPIILNDPKITFQVEASDSQFSDYQTITVERV